MIKKEAKINPDYISSPVNVEYGTTTFIEPNDTLRINCPNKPVFIQRINNNTMKSKDQVLLEECYQLVCESMHGDNWAKTTWEDTTKDGKHIKVTFKDILEFAKDIPVEELSVENLKHLALHNTKTDPETLANIQKANLDYPILVLDKSKDKKNQHLGLVSILDGHHRLQKAINNKIKTIKAKTLYLADMPEDWQELFS